MGLNQAPENFQIKSIVNNMQYTKIFWHKGKTEETINLQAEIVLFIAGCLHSQQLCSLKMLHARRINRDIHLHFWWIFYSHLFTHQSTTEDESSQFLEAPLTHILLI